MGRRARRDLCLALILMAGVALTAMIAAIPRSTGSNGLSWTRSVRNWWYAQDDLTQCKSNLKNMGTALEMYSTDNGGRFPQNTSGLTPNYLRQIPTCPATGTDTYTSGYSGAS